MRLVRLILIASILLAAYSTALLVYLFPWAWLALAIGAAYGATKAGIRYTAYGTARWADATDLQGMLDGNGLIIGHIDSRPRLAVRPLFNPRISSEIACRQFLDRFRRKRPKQLVTLSKAVHTAVFAPTGVGKGVSFVVPHLLTCPDSCVVVDFKGENAKLTAAARRAMGHKVVLLDPFRVLRNEKSDTFNPINFIPQDSKFAIDECRDLAKSLVVRTGEEREPHWNDNAELWIQAMTACVVHTLEDGEDRSLQGVRELITDAELMKQAMVRMCESDAWEGMLARLGHQLKQFVDRELGSTLTTTNRHMRFLDTLAVASNTRSSSFDPADLVKGKMTIYLILPPEHMSSQMSLLRLWIGSFLRAVVREGLNDRRRVHFMLDEAASLGRMDVLNDAVDKYRGYGVRLQFYYQSMGQLKDCWTEGGQQTLLSNTTQVFFGVNDQSTAEYVSNRLGEKTIIVTSGGRSGGTTTQSSDHSCRSTSYAKNWNDGWQQHGRKLLRPEEVMALSKRIAITFMAGVPPIWTTLVRYYEGPLKRPGKFWPTAKAFLDAVALLVAMGMLALALTQMAGESPQPVGMPAPEEYWLFR